MNSIEPSFVEKGVALPLMEAFYTIQGEGRFSGHAAYFIRLGGCDVGCVWCDVKESWEAGKWPILPIEKIVADALSFPGRLVVITGGEPLLYDLGPLTQLLKSKGFSTHLETSGAHPFSGDFDWVCFSPKKFKKPEQAFSWIKIIKKEINGIAGIFIIFSFFDLAGHFIQNENNYNYFIIILCVLTIVMNLIMRYIKKI